MVILEIDLSDYKTKTAIVLLLLHFKEAKTCNEGEMMQ